MNLASQTSETFRLPIDILLREDNNSKSQIIVKAIEFQCNRHFIDLNPCQKFTDGPRLMDDDNVGKTNKTELIKACKAGLVSWVPAGEIEAGGVNGIIYWPLNKERENISQENKARPEPIVKTGVVAPQGSKAAPTNIPRVKSKEIACMAVIFGLIQAGATSAKSIRDKLKKEHYVIGYLSDPQLQKFVDLIINRRNLDGENFEEAQLILADDPEYIAIKREILASMKEIN